VAVVLFNRYLMRGGHGFPGPRCLWLDERGWRRARRAAAPLGARLRAQDFEDFYQANYGHVVMLLTAMLADGGAARDAAQETFARALARWRGPDGHQVPEMWVRQLALRVGMRYARRTRSRAAEPGAAAADVIPVAGAMGRLPPRQREAIVLHYLGGLPADHIAAGHGLPAWVVRARLAAAERRLSEDLAAPPGEREPERREEAGDRAPSPGTVRREEAGDRAPSPGTERHEETGRPGPSLAEELRAWVGAARHAEPPGIGVIRRRRRRRSWRHTAAGLACAAVTAAVVLVRVATAPVPAPRPHLPQCPDRDLRIGWAKAPATNPGMSLDPPPVIYLLVFRNTGAAPCSLDGWPLLTLTKPRDLRAVPVSYGTITLRLGKRAARYRAVSAAEVAIQPGHSAVAAVTVSFIPRVAHCARPAWAATAPHGQTATLLPGGPGLTARRSPLGMPLLCLDSTVVVSPVYPAALAAGPG
jgi:RNA polymerase sigma-70 factor, ECF subfamily